MWYHRGAYPSHMFKEASFLESSLNALHLYKIQLHAGIPAKHGYRNLYLLLFRIYFIHNADKTLQRAGSDHHIFTHLDIQLDMDILHAYRPNFRIRKGNRLCLLYTSRCV